MSMMGVAQWYESHDNVLHLARWLVHEEDYGAESLLEYFEKPYKWANEWQHMQAHDEIENELRAHMPSAWKERIQASKMRAAVREKCLACNPAGPTD